MKILIGADIVPTKSNMQNFEEMDINSILQDGLRETLNSADYRIFNLEVPLADKESPIVKCGPNMIASVKSADGIKAIGTDFLTLANNHILDHGEKGLFSTIDLLKQNGICCAGAGKNLAEAAKPFIFEKESKRIGIYCCAEHEFSIATEEKAGANPFDPLNSLDHIADLEKQCDFVIVLYHGGKEQYRYPSPYLQKVCRKMIEKGADLVICQHTHCIGCEEKYQNGTIVYGQGNFLFDDTDNEYWNTSLLIQAELTDKCEITYIPLEKRGRAVALAGKERKQILKEFQLRSEEIRNPGFIEQAYKDIADREYIRYLTALQGKRYHSIAFRAVNKLTGYRLKKFLLKKQYKNPDAKAAIQNVLDCEAHREGLLYALKNSEKI